MRSSFDTPGTPTLEQPPHVRSALVFRALKLGDMLCSIPALRALRRRWPSARIDLVTLPASRELIERYPSCVDSVIDFPGFPGLPEVEPDVPAFLELVSLLRTRSYDVAIQLHGNGPISNSIVAMFGARYTAGLATADAWRPSPGSYLEPPAAAHEIHRCLGLVSTLGCDTDDRLEFPITADDIASTHRPGFPGNGRFVCIHAGSAAPARRWPVARFAAVANHLSGLSYRVVLTGTAAERDLTAELANRLRVPVLDLAGRTSLGAMAALLKASALLVCNDTGVSHLAAAVGARAVVVSSDHEPWRWAPLHTSRITTLTSDPASPLAAAAVIAAADDHLGISSTPGAVA